MPPLSVPKAEMVKMLSQHSSQMVSRQDHIPYGLKFAFCKFGVINGSRSITRVLLEGRVCNIFSEVVKRGHPNVLGHLSPTCIRDLTVCEGTVMGSGQRA